MFINKISAQLNTKNNYMLNAVINHIIRSVKIYFWYLLVLYINSIVKCLKAPKWPLFYFQPILVVISVTIATVNVKLIPDFYIWAIALINEYMKKLVKINFYFVASQGDQNSPFVHVAAFKLEMC